MLGSRLLKHFFKTVSMGLCKSGSPVSIVQDEWKLRGWFLRIKSIHVGLAWFLKQVDCKTQKMLLNNCLKFQN